MTLTPEDQAYLDELPGSGAFNPTVAHPARRYNYWLGGKDNFDADRRSADEIERLVPGMRAGVRANREVLRRVVSFLAGEQGVRQFLDVGTGLPTADNTHEVAQRIAPDSQVVYADNDRYLPGSMHTWVVLLKGASRVARGGVRTGQHW